MICYYFYSCIWLQRKIFFPIVCTYGLHAPVVEKVHNANHQWINLCPPDSHSAVCFLNTSLPDSDVQTGDNAIQGINLYSVDNTIDFHHTYPLDSVLFNG